MLHVIFSFFIFYYTSFIHTDEALEHGRFPGRSSAEYS